MPTPSLHGYLMLGCKWLLCEVGGGKDGVRRELGAHASEMHALMPCPPRVCGKAPRSFQSQRTAARFEWSRNGAARDQAL